MAEKKIFGPASKPQEDFLNSTANICIVGGAAGAGKSYCSLLHHLKYINDPHYRGLILRRTTPMLLKPGAIFDEAKALYRDFCPDVKIRLKDLKFIFPSGAEVAFAHFERVDDTNNFQGAQLSSVVFDELTHFEESQFVYLLSRLRSKANMIPCARATCNPDINSFLRKWVDWWLYPREHELFGRPDPTKAGKVRWFVRLGNLMVWGDSHEELKKKYPKLNPLSFQFIPANIYDNPRLMESNPGYVAYLESLPRVDRERLLYGNWEAREEASGFFKREWVIETSEIPDRSQIVRTVRAWDIAGSVVSETSPSPDYTVGVKMSKLRDGTYIIEDVLRFRARYGEVTKRIIQTAVEDGTRVDIVIPRDPGAAGLAASQMLISEITSYGFAVRSRPTNKSKVERFRPFASAAEGQLIKILKNCCNDLENNISGNNDFFYSELEAFDGGRKGHDDCCDAVGDSYITLAQSNHIPLFDLPDLTCTNEYKIYTH